MQLTPLKGKAVVLLLTYVLNRLIHIIELHIYCVKFAKGLVFIDRERAYISLV